MKIRWLEYFVAVAEELHFGRAAERLGIAQPPLSRQIKQIEEDLGALLFNRGRSQVTLTQAGAKLYERAQEILANLEEAKLEARRIGQGAEGRLRIGFVGSSTYGVVPNVLKSFRRHYPAVALGLFPMNNAGLRTALVRREIDIAIARPRLDDPEILSRQLIVEPLVLATPDSHPLVDQRAVSLEDIASETLILYPEKPRPSFADHVLGLFHAEGLEPTSRVFTMDFQTAISLVSVEVGCAIVPSSVGEARRKGVRFVPLAHPEATTAVSVNTRIDDPSVHIKNFVDIALRVSRRLGVDTPEASR
ncbi:LysR family transcriptional regulator [Stappia indica]|uniref:LysR family transcriptional regulator n=1 Tax=Stappia indica TaxID=538381 RepID=UPI001CD41D38|nr:LysR family transcriptional regulator [Stappia indica]MCA1300468.1 LysR family transcriptional regulator [Stappia indica]